MANRQTIIVSSPPTPRPGNPLAISGLVVSVIAVAICWLPFLGMVAIPLGLLAVVLSLIGAVLAFAWGRSGRSSAFVGMALGVGSMVLAFLVTGASVQAIDQALNAPPTMVASTPQIAAPKADVVLKPQPQPKALPEPEPAPEPELEVIEAPNPSQIGDIVARVISAKIMKVPLVGLAGNRQISKDPLLVLIVEASNISETRKATYKTWAGADIASIDRSANLSDNFGNAYKRATLGIAKPDGRVMSEASIYPGASITDVLVYEIPIRKAEYLQIEMPADNVGESGAFRFRIPASLIVGSQETPTIATNQGHPSLEGTWLESESPEIKFTVQQNGSRFVAQTVYSLPDAGEIRATVIGDIDKDGKIKAVLKHTQAPDHWAKEQVRMGTLSDDGMTINGTARFVSGGHDFVWRRID